ncbi:hypothetical protein Vafri_345 [Volvox africanus]|nr:hypothetical protein Vafri_345 [Volvox africanus]
MDRSVKLGFRQNCAPAAQLCALVKGFRRNGRVQACAPTKWESIGEQIVRTSTRRQRTDASGPPPAARQLHGPPPGVAKSNPSGPSYTSPPQRTRTSSSPSISPSSRQQPTDQAIEQCIAQQRSTEPTHLPPPPPCPKTATYTGSPSPSSSFDAVAATDLAITSSSQSHENCAKIGAGSGVTQLPSAAADTVTTVTGQALPLELLHQYHLSDQQLNQLEIYLDYLLEVNQSMNLTAVRDKGDAWQRHVADSLALLPVIDRYIPSVSAAAGRGARSFEGQGRGRSADVSSHINSRRKGDISGDRRGGSDDHDDGRGLTNSGSSSSSSTGSRGSSGGSESSSNSTGTSSSSGSEVGSASGLQNGAVVVAPLRLVDVGTGAGLPGMVLAVARPQWKVTLLDSLRKRCDFLGEAASRAGLDNVEVVWCRAEEGARRPELRQVFDIAVARAVAESRVLAELCLPFVRVGGLWVAAKGPDPETEVLAASNAIRQLGGRQLALERVDSHSAEGQRTALVVAKAASTPDRFPRQPGTPNKKPL